MDQRLGLLGPIDLENELVLAGLQLELQKRAALRLGLDQLLELVLNARPRGEVKPQPLRGLLSLEQRLFAEARDGIETFGLLARIQGAGNDWIFRHGATLALQPTLKSRGEMEEAILSIGEVAERAGVRASAIRYYESLGVLPEPQRENGQRRYPPEAIERVRVIGVAQQAGFSLPEIRALLESSDQGQVSNQLKTLAERKLPEVEELIVRAQAMKAWLETATGCNCSTLDVCALFDPDHAGPDRGVAAPELPVVRAGASGARTSVGS